MFSVFCKSKLREVCLKCKNSKYNNTIFFISFLALVTTVTCIKKQSSSSCEPSNSWLPSLHSSLRSHSLLSFSSPTRIAPFLPLPTFLSLLSPFAPLSSLSLRFVLLSLACALSLSLWRRSERRELSRHHQRPRWNSGVDMGLRGRQSVDRQHSRNSIAQCAGQK